MSTGGSIRAAVGFRRGLIAAAALLTAGCTSVNSTAASFERTEWQVTAINGQVTPRTDSYRLSFQRGQAGGRFGCNHFGGPYRVEGQMLMLGEVASTLMGCPEPAATHETQGFTVLRQPMRIEWHSDRRLTLSNSAGSIDLELHR